MAIEDRPREGIDPEDELTRAPDTSSRESIIIGPYRLLQRIGAGGMGDVWLAEQARPVRRQVALKIIKAGMGTEQVLARFEAERQALALMDHPGIARVLDAGTTPQGRPYFAMEYVRGEPLTIYCDRHKLSIRERLDLFVQICDGVQHAHQKGIIHRDLKPSNVLVAIQDDHPVPKIIDFGVAKATAQALTERPLQTEFGAIIGTPEYMSPEQAEMTGLDVDTRTDVYTLGVMLYELLTGSLPFASSILRERGLDEARRTIREVDPPRPSTRVLSLQTDASSRRLKSSRVASQLRGDLDWITMKALEKDRTRRYQTANAFALDIRRHFSGEPVSAAPPSPAYRLGKFVRRNRVGVTAAGVLVFLLLAFTAAMALQTRRVAEERDRANREAATANAVSTFLREDLLAQGAAVGQARPDSRPDPNLTVRTVLDRAAERLPVKFASEPQVEAALRHTIAHAYEDLGLYGAAEQHYVVASDLRRRTLGETHSDTLQSMMALGNLYRLQGKYALSEAQLTRVLDARRRVSGEASAETANAADDLAIVYRVLGKFQQAERLYVKSLESRRQTLGESHEETLSGVTNLGMLYVATGEYELAERTLRRGMELAPGSLGDEHRVTMTLMNNLALALSNQGKSSQAEPIYLSLLERARRVWGEKHPNTLRAATNLGNLYTAEGKYAEAEALIAGSLAAERDTLGEEHPNTLSSGHVLAVLYQAQHRYAEAAKLWGLVVASRRRVLGDENPATLSSIASEADLLIAQRKYDEAGIALAAVLESQRRSIGNQHPDTLRTMTSLGRALIRQQKFVEAERALREVVGLYEQRSPDDWRRYESQSLLGLSLAGLKRRTEAEPLLAAGEAGIERLKDRVPAFQRQALENEGEEIGQLSDRQLSSK